MSKSLAVSRQVVQYQKPIDFHCHGLGDADFADPSQVDLYETDKLAQIE